MKLDNTEKNYLKDVITATRVYLNKPEVYVRKLALNSLGINRECIVIQASTSDAEAAINSITLPTFEAGTMYTGLAPNVLYKLNDLLNEQETPELNRKEYNFLVSLEYMNDEENVVASSIVNTEVTYLGYSGMPVFTSLPSNTELALVIVPASALSGSKVYFKIY